MILEVPYLRFSEYSDSVSSTAVLAASMVLSYHEIPHSLQELDTLFCKTILSNDFNREYLDARNDFPDKIDRAVFCIRKIFSDNYPELSTRLFATTIDKIHGSFIKRGMPVIMTGTFPMLSGRSKSHIVVVGMEDGDFLIHDTMGNAMTSYRERNGQYSRYPFTFLDQASISQKPILLITEKIKTI